MFAQFVMIYIKSLESLYILPHPSAPIPLSASWCCTDMPNIAILEAS